MRIIFPKIELTIALKQKKNIIVGYYMYVFCNERDKRHSVFNF